MYEPIRDNNRDATSAQTEMPSCTGGWNTSDNVSRMSITDAVVMDNWMPKEGYVSLREGYTSVVADDSISKLGEIGTLMAYDVENISPLVPDAQVDSIMFFAKKEGENPKLYKVRPYDLAPIATGIDTTGASINSNKWNYILYRKTLIMTKGGSTPLFFIETATGGASSAYILTISVSDEPDIAPYTLTNTMLDKVTLYRDRLFFSVKNELFLCYADPRGAVPVPVDPSHPVSIKLIRKDISMFCSKGGSVALLANWTKTGAESLGNLLVVITTKGEVLVFSGTDPSAIDLDPAKWNFEGKFEIPAVLPDSNAVRVGGDLVIMTVEGYIGLGDLLNASFINTDKALSNKIDAAVKEVVRFKDFQHWNLTFSIGENILIANVPRTKNLGKYKTDQHVLNLSTGAWCRFVGLDATCFVTFRDSIYFGKVEGGLFEMFKGDTDAGQYIKGYVQQAYSNFGSPKIKTFKRMDIIASNSLGINFAMNFSVDFRRAANNANVSVTPIGATWDNTVWDTSLWNSGGVSRLVPTVINANSGVFGSVGISVYTNYSDIKWYSTILTMSIAK